MHNKKKSFFSVLCLSTALQITGCPTCVARVEKNSPPFFEDEDVQKLSSSPTQSQSSTAQKPKTQPMPQQKTTTVKPQPAKKITPQQPPKK